MNIMNNLNYMLWWPQNRRYQGNHLERMTHNQYKRRVIRQANRQLLREANIPFGFVQARRANAMLRPGIEFGSDDWYPMDELIDEQPWTRNWRREPEAITFDKTPGNTTRPPRRLNQENGQLQTIRPSVPGEWPMTPNVRE